MTDSRYNHRDSLASILATERSRLAKLERTSNVNPYMPLMVVPQRAMNFTGTPHTSVTSGTFVVAYTANVESVSQPGFLSTVGIVCSAGTIGEIRIATTEGATTSTVNCPDGSSDDYRFQWLHEASLGLATSFNVEARRVSGAGSVSVYWPTMTVAPSLACNETGVAPFPE